MESDLTESKTLCISCKTTWTLSWTFLNELSWELFTKTSSSLDARCNGRHSRFPAQPFSACAIAATCRYSLVFCRDSLYAVKVVKHVSMSSTTNSVSFSYVLRRALTSMAGSLSTLFKIVAFLLQQDMVVCSLTSTYKHAILDDYFHINLVLN